MLNGLQGLRLSKPILCGMLQRMLERMYNTPEQKEASDSWNKEIGGIVCGKRLARLCGEVDFERIAY